MKKTKCINKLVMTAEAKFDYEEGMSLGEMPKKDIKNTVEEYLSIKESEGKQTYFSYFRLKYYDESADKMLMLFFYKGISFGRLQMWKLVGICLEDDWSEEDEDDGLIRNWLKIKVEDLPNEEDWVVRFRVWQKEQKRFQEEYND